MPHITVRLSGPENAALDRRVADTIADLTADILHKERGVIAIEIHHVPAERWFVGGRSLAERKEQAFNLEISITDETNTKAEKAAYLRKVHAAMATLHAPLCEVSYVHLVDARAAAYGYGGRTQEYRHQQGGV